MRKKNVLRMCALMPLLLSLAAVFPMVAPGLAQVDSYPAQALWVDLDVTAPVPNCNNFTVDIYVNVSTAGMNPGATGLYAWEFRLYWENDKLNCTGATDHLPSADWASPNSFPAGIGLNQSYNATHGLYWRGISALPMQQPFPTPFVGVMSICTIDFHVIHEGAQYDAPLSLSKIYGIDIMMGDDTGGGFDFTAYENSVPVIPEFSVTLIVPLFVLATLVTATLAKTTWSRKPKGNIDVK